MSPRVEFLVETEPEEWWVIRVVRTKKTLAFRESEEEARDLAEIKFAHHHEAIEWLRANVTIEEAPE